MDISLWDILTLVSKILFYASVATAIGGVFASVLLSRHRESSQAISRYIGWGCLGGVGVTVVGFLSQVGTFADQGLAGMMDVDTLFIMIQTSVGSAFVLSLGGFLLIGFSNWWLLKRLPRQRIFPLTLAALGAMSVLTSFSQIGHLADASLIGKVAISLHVLAMSFWMGSLYPLWLVSRTSDVTAIRQSMDLFGRLAVLIVGTLVTCGVVMSVLLLKDIHTLLSTPYGRGLLLKLILVGGLLLLAACNKWFTVPRLMQAGFSARLSNSIVLEMMVGGLILIITGVITTLIGLEVHS